MITKNQTLLLQSAFIAIIAGIYSTIVWIFKLNILESFLLLLSMPVFLFTILTFLKPAMTAYLHKAKGGMIGKDIQQATRNRLKRQGMKNFQNAPWNVEGVEIWAVNEQNAKRKYGSAEYVAIRKGAKMNLRMSINEEIRKA